jgi:threonine/homoserine/homoserine lactone efflux protein
MTYALVGLSLGLSAGVSPGPLLALVMQRSLKGGFASGARVAFSPLLSDLPIVLLAVLLVGQLPDRALDGLLVVGGLFVIWLGISGFRRSGAGLDSTEVTTAQQDFLHGALVNFLSPHPYLFWATVGAPILIRAWRSSPGDAFVFLLGFYVTLIGSKVVFAFLFSRAQGLPAHWHVRLIRFSSLLLVGVGVLMLYAAYQSFRTPA